MEKISRILPPSARTSTYDASRAQPARPGALRLGRPQAFEPVVDRVTLSESLTDSADDFPIPMSNSKLAASQYTSKDNVKAEMVRKMTDDFFMKNSVPKSQTISEEVAERADDSTESRVSPESSNELSL